MPLENDAGLEDEAWEANKKDMAEYLARRAAFHAEERSRAEAHVSKVLSTYRWWGWTNIVNTIRVAIASWRFKREQAKKA